MNEESTTYPGIPSNDLTGVVITPVENSELPKKNWIEELCQREATPKAERTETIEAFCEKHGIARSTYNYQKNKKENKRRIVEIWLNEAADGGNEVLAKLKQNALEGKEKSIEMYLKFVLELAENLDIKSGGKPIPIYGAISRHQSNKEDISAQEENQGG